MELKYKINNNSFHARASAIIYNKDKTKVLLFKVDDRDYFLLPGGRIKFNEDSLSAIKREILEETGFELEYKLCSIEENFLKRNDEKIMQYCFCYKAIYDKNINETKFKCNDNSGQTFYWMNIHELKDIKLFPKESINYIKSNNNNIEHLIERGVSDE